MEVQVLSDRELWLVAMTPWTQLVPSMDSWVLLDVLGLCSGDLPTDLAVFLTQRILIQLDVPELVSKEKGPTGALSARTGMVWEVIHMLRDEPTIGPRVADTVARRIAKHGLPKEPIFLSQTGSTWFVSIESASSDAWGVSEIPPAEQPALLHLMRLGGLLSFRSRKEAVINIRKTGTVDQNSGLFGSHWLPPASNVYGWAFELP